MCVWVIMELNRKSKRNKWKRKKKLNDQPHEPPHHDISPFFFSHFIFCLGLKFSSLSIFLFRFPLVSSWAAPSWPSRPSNPPPRPRSWQEEHEQKRPWQFILPLFLPPILVLSSLRSQHETCPEFNGDFIQVIIFPHVRQNSPIQTREPNANRRHSSPDLPPQCIPIRTEASTICPLSFSSTFGLRPSPENPSTARALDV